MRYTEHKAQGRPRRPPPPSTNAPRSESKATAHREEKEGPPAHLLDEGSELLVRVVVVHADPALDRYRRVVPRPVLHRQTQVLHEGGRSHESRSKGPLPRHLIAGAAAVQVDGVVVVRASKATGFTNVCRV